METMTPEQKIKHAILAKAIAASAVSVAVPLTAENIDGLYDANNEDYELQDWMNEFREGEVETNIPAPWSPHYEAKSVAAKMDDGSWIGWTYWYGGGKHAEPEAIDWMDESYELTCTEEQKVMTVRTFTKASDEKTA